MEVPLAELLLRLEVGLTLALGSRVPIFRFDTISESDLVAKILHFLLGLRRNLLRCYLFSDNFLFDVLSLILIRLIVIYLLRFNIDLDLFSRSDLLPFLLLLLHLDLSWKVCAKAKGLFILFI